MSNSFVVSRFRDRRFNKQLIFSGPDFRKNQSNPFIDYLKCTKRDISIWSVTRKEEQRLDNEYDRERRLLLRRKSILVNVCKLSKNKKERRVAAANLERLGSKLLSGISDSLNFQKDASILLLDFEEKYDEFTRSCLSRENMEGMWGVVEAVLFLCGRKLIIGEERCDCNGECENCVSYRTGGIGFVKSKRINNAPYSKSSYMKGCISRYCGILPRSKIYKDIVFDVIRNFILDEYNIFYKESYATFEEFLTEKINVFEIKLIIYILSTVAKKKKVFEISDEDILINEEEWVKYRLNGGTLLGKCKRGLYKTFEVLKRSCRKTIMNIDVLKLMCGQIMVFARHSKDTGNIFETMEKLDKVVSYVYYPRLTGKKLYNILPLQAGVYKNFPIQEKAIEKFMKGKRKNSPNVWIRLYFLLRKLYQGDPENVHIHLPKKNFYPITNVHSATCGCKISKLQKPIENLIKESWEDLGWEWTGDTDDLCFV